VLAPIIKFLSPLKVIVPVPRLREDVPTKVKSAFIAIGFAKLLVIAEPLVLSSVQAPLIVKVPAAVPNALKLLMFNVPLPTVTPPIKVLLPDNVSVPPPDFMILQAAPLPLITPEIINVTPLFTVKVVLADMPRGLKIVASPVIEEVEVLLIVNFRPEIEVPAAIDDIVLQTPAVTDILGLFTVAGIIRSSVLLGILARLQFDPRFHTLVPPNHVFGAAFRLFPKKSIIRTSPMSKYCFNWSCVFII